MGTSVLHMHGLRALRASMRLPMRVAAQLTTALIFWGLAPSALANPGSTTGVDPLRAFLQKKVSWGPAEDKDMRYSFARVSLDEKTEQVFVYLSGPGWCGSGGCTALLLQLEGVSYRIVDKFTLVHLPIRILPSLTNGWHDIAMLVQGGGITDGHMAILRFDGHAYPDNPSLAPKLPETEAAVGTSVQLSERGSLVY